MVRATAEGIVLPVEDSLLFTRVNRMHPLVNVQPMLPRFKEEFAQHKEFLLAPVTQRKDGQLWVDVDFGIIKRVVHFRDIAEIAAGDIDAAALNVPAVAPPQVRDS